MDKTLAALGAEIRAAVEGAEERELQFSPAAGVWSPALVLEHLQRTYTGTSKGLSRVLEGGAPLVTPTPVKMKVMQMFVLGAGWLPKGRKSPKQAEPLGEVAATDIPKTIQQKLVEMDALLEQCEKRFGRGKVLDHPILGALTVEQWRKFHLVHGRHHVKQIKERRALAGRA